MLIMTVINTMALILWIICLLGDLFQEKHKYSMQLIAAHACLVMYTAAAVVNGSSN